jgi:asparagine synthase (glutamine-hydrolysing)
MCGIFGIVARNGKIPEGVLERATSSLAHRGPDDSGTVALHDSSQGDTEVGLGSRRLAIVDLSPLAHQPMRDSENGNWIVYNGEVYNFREVRNELEKLGTGFTSHSDTEVVLKAFGRWGEQCLDRLRGMFAFAIWNAKEHRLFIARDPMGIKPLYYAQSGSYFVFASEIRTLLGTGLIPFRLDPSGITNYLTFGSAYDPLTVVDGIRALPAGTSLSWKGAEICETPYWDLIDDSAGRLGVSDDERQAARQLQPALEEVVRMQMVSDVPVGVFLSGGIDSSALVSILSRSGITPSTFSIVFREADFSEAEYSREIASKFRTDHHEINVSQQDVLSAIPDAIGAMDLPTMDGVNTYFVSRETRNAGVKVALSGLGGDEVFGGYSTFRTVPRMERFAKTWNRVPRMLGSPLASVFRAVAPSSDQNRKLTSLARDNGRVMHPYFLTRMLFTPAQRDSLLREVDEASQDVAVSSQKVWVERASGLDSLNRVSYLESRCYMLNTLLRDADVMSMAHGLEVRVPLIDHRLAQTVLALPGKWKVNGTPKKLLVGVLDGSLPDRIVHRKKRGFTLPFEHWMRQDLRLEIEQVLTARRINEGPLGGLLNGVEVEKVWRDFLNRSMSWSRPWSLYVLQKWCELRSGVSSHL